MKNNLLAFKQAFHDAEVSSRKAHLSWIKTVITILTPSLVLLIGLQDNSQSLTILQTAFLVFSIVMMSATILIGLALLHGESLGYRLLRDSIAEQWDNDKSLDQSGVALANIYGYALIAFSYLTILSILFLTMFGVSKYVT